MRKLLFAAFVTAATLCLCGCEPPGSEGDTITASVTTTVQETTETTTTTAVTTTIAENSVSETTTSKIGGFVIYDGPGEDSGSWEDIGTAE